MAVKSKSELKKQICFIDNLIDKLKVDLNEGMNYFESNDIYRGLPGYSRMQNDIIRIRRELNMLSKMLDPYGDR